MFTTDEMGQSKWMTKIDELDIRRMYGCEDQRPEGNHIKDLLEY